MWCCQPSYLSRCALQIPSKFATDWQVSQVVQYQKFWGAGRLVFETDIELDDDGKVIAVARELQVRPTGKRLTASEIRLLVQVHNRVAGEANRGLTIGIY